MEIEQVVAIQRMALEKLVPPIEAIGIGGSFGKGSRDMYSDADFFLLYPSNGFFQNLIIFPNLIEHPRIVLTFSGPDFVPGFGFEYSYILEGGIAVDYNLNCRETLNLNPMRAHTEVLFDSTGYLTEFTKRAEEDARRTPAGVLSLAMHDYLVRLLKVRKAAYRRDLPVLLYNLDKLRLVLAGLDRTITRGSAYNSIQADHQLGLQMGEDYGHLFLGTFPEGNYMDVKRCTDAISQGIEVKLCALGGEEEKWRCHWVLASELRKSIDNLLEDLTAHGG